MRKTKTPNRRCLKRVVRQIAHELLTVNNGDANEQTGNRLAIMQGIYPYENNLGGRCREVIEAVILRHLSNADLRHGVGNCASQPKGQTNEK
jgi:hypothetical protein